MQCKCGWGLSLHVQILYRFLPFAVPAPFFPAQRFGVSVAGVASACPVLLICSKSFVREGNVVLHTLQIYQ